MFISVRAPSAGTHRVTSSLWELTTFPSTTSSTMTICFLVVTLVGPEEAVEEVEEEEVLEVVEVVVLLQ